MLICLTSLKLDSKIEVCVSAAFCMRCHNTPRGRFGAQEAEAGVLRWKNVHIVDVLVVTSVISVIVDCWRRLDSW